MTITPTTITKQMLIDKAACPEWIDKFHYRKPEGLKIHTIADILDAIKYGGFGPVVSWLIKLDVVDKLDLTRANLTGANLTRANLTGANLREADLREADLTGADLTGADLTGAIGYE